MKRFAAALLALLFLSAPAVAATRVVLPDTVRPDRYDLTITPNAADLTFKGQAKIAVKVVRATDRIVLNAADLKLGAARLSGVAETPRIVLDDKVQTASFVFSKPLAPGAYTLSIDYTGVIYQQASGLFALDYTAADGGKRRALYTQFENSDARRFAPMWDEPGVKAVFALTVRAPKDQMVISNMPVASTQTGKDGLATVRFADSPKMSSYLLFLGMGEFERIHQQVGKTDVGVVVRKGDTERGRFALDAAVKLLPYFDEWFGAPYPLPKLDLVAAPGRSQFFSAMENWGAIFYFDYALLVDPKLSTESDRQGVFTTIAHEMAHQWFGDLVTMAWWDDLWLNEGFASWMETKATHQFHPEWNIPLGAIAGQQGAMRLDARAGTHPVIAEIPDVFAAAGAFDAITYQKGQAVIGMLETYVGPDAFQAGVRRYIRAHQYGNTVSDDLWNALDAESPRKVRDVAHDFLTQPGVPLIRAEAAPGGLRLTQSRFGVDETQRTPQTWRTPVIVTGLDGKRWEGVVSADAPQTVPITGPAVVNAGLSGYFRTAYAPELWAALTPRFAELAPADQLGLLYDSRALGEAGMAPMSDVLALARNAPAGADPLVLDTLASLLEAQDWLYDGRASQAAFRTFARARLAPMAERLGWDPKPGEPDNAAVARRTVLTTLGRMGDPAVISEARRRFAAWRKDPGSLKGAGRRTVLAIVAAHADPATWEELRQIALASTDATDRSRLFALLGQSDDPALADRTLAFALEGKLQPTEVPDLIAAVAGSHPDRAFDFAIANRAKIESLLEPTSRSGYFAELAAGSRDPAMLPKLAAYRASIPPSAAGEADKAISAVRYRVDVITNRLPDAERWLAVNAN